jgi:hypothetical protein
MPNKRNTSPGTLEHTCPVCGATFRRWPSDPAKFCSHRCAHRGPNNHQWRGGRTLSRGYVQVWDAERRRVPEHRKVLEDLLERRLESFEIVHHRDHTKTNNAADNLEIVDRSAHPHRHRGYTDDHLIAAIRELARRTGRRPAFKALDAYPDLPSRSAFVAAFGSWGAALKRAGYPLYDHVSHR